MSVGKFAFLPNLRSSAAAGATIDDIRPRLTYDLEITGNGSAQGARVPVAAELKGPGDVVGINASQITRIEPEDANKGFEPNYFPFIQLRDPDLPWRYSLTTGTKNRMMPWIALVALRDDEFSYLSQGSALAPRIQVNTIKSSLPNLTQAWATAHVQVDMDGVSGEPGQVLEDDPGRGFARMMAFRKLDAGTDYTLFVVPVYKVGVQAALGQLPDPNDGDTIAWDITSEDAITLPYFFRHRFKTETGQDMETLLRKLRAVKADEKDEAGTPLWVSAEDTGYYDGLTSPGYSFAAQAALAQPDYDVPSVDTPDPLMTSMANTLDQVLAEQELDEDEDPLLTFPAHGAHYSPRAEVKKSRAMQGFWFERTNLDLKFRAAAGLGRQIVKENDEHFAQLCWEQYDEVLAANEALRHLQVATTLAWNMQQRHYARLPSETGVQLAEPLTRYVRADPKDDKGPSIRGMLESNQVPEGFAGLSLRRVLARKPERVRDDRKTLGRRVPMAALPGDKTPSAASRPRRDSAILKRREVLAARREDKQMQAALRKLFNAELLGRRPRPNLPQGQVGSYASEALQKLVGDKLMALPKQKADYLVTGRSPSELNAGGIIYRAPRVPEPMVDYLMKISRDGVLSNARALPENTVSFYEENRAFVEALMVGANHAMNEELRWREYPTDMRGTIFHRFWNRGALPDDKRQDDIDEIRTWPGKLGQNPNPADADGKANLVVVIKGEVVRKLGDPIVAVSIARNGAEWDPGSAQNHDPVFFGKIGRDAVYYGFDISRDYLMEPNIRNRAYFAIYEPPARLRFGLDVGTATIRAARPTVPDLAMTMVKPDLNSWDDLSWAHMSLTAADYVNFSKQIAMPPNAHGNYWNSTKHSAGLVRSFWQKPLAALLPLERVL